MAFSGFWLASAVTPAVAQTSAAIYTTGYRWDAMRRLVGTIKPAASGTAGPFLATRYTYDAEGRLLRTEDGYLTNWQDETVSPVNWPSASFNVAKQVDASYDAFGNKLTEKASSAGTAYTLTQYSYDAGDRQTCTAIRMNSAIYASLPASACTLGTQGSQGPDRIMQNVYDVAGQLVQIRRAVGTSLEEAYATYAYSQNGKQTDVIDAVGTHSVLTYDGFDRQVQWTFPSTTKPGAFNGATQATALATAGLPNAADYEAYAYDANNNRTSLRKRDTAVLTYVYDALNRMTSKIVPQRVGLPATDARSVYYSYDLLGHQLSAQFDSPGGEGITNGWDRLGRQTSSTLTMDGAARTSSYLYDANSNRTQVTFPEGSVGGYYVTYSYDGLDRPYLIQRSGSSTIANYTYDAKGRRDGFTGGIATSYAYDGINRPTSLTNTPNSNAGYANSYGFSYNPAGQITQLTKSNTSFAFGGTYNVNRNYTTNGLNQYTAAGTGSFGYDANGNLTSDIWTTFLYDNENRLVGAGGAKNAALRYDPAGRLYEVSGPSGTTRYFYDGDALIGEYDGSGALLRRYVHGADLKADDPIAWYEGATFSGASERILRSDWQGSIVLATDNAGQAIYAANTFDEYGIPGANNAGRFQYTGQAWQSELGMYYYKARMYSPTLGRFMQTDPIGYKDQINLYAYVANDPVNRSDPTGLWTCEECSKDGLKVAKAFVSGVQDAAGRKGASAALKAVSASLGKFGEAGVNVGFGSLDPGHLGEQAGANVTLDAGQIVSASRDIQKANGISSRDALRALGAATVAHEVQHYNDRNILNRDNQMLRKEMRAYRVQNETMMRLGVDGNGYDHRYPYDMNVRRQGLYSCNADLISTGYLPGAAQASCSNQ